MSIAISDIEERIFDSLDYRIRLEDKTLLPDIGSFLRQKFIHQSDKLRIFCEKIQQWNKSINLIGSSDLDTIITNHVVDSGLASVIVSYRTEITEINWLDIGSGAGFPGMVIALIWPESEIYLCEPRLSRYHFLQELRLALRLNNVRVIRSRLEDLHIEYSDLGNQRLQEQISVAITRATGQPIEFMQSIRSNLPQCKYFAEITKLQNSGKENIKSGFSSDFLDAYFLDKKPRCVRMWSMR